MTDETKGQDEAAAEPAKAPAKPAKAPAKEASTRPEGDEGRAVREHQDRLQQADKLRGF